MKSLRVDPNGKRADTKNSNLKELSSFIYNRHTHDKTMCVKVAEINFMIALGSIFNDNKDKDDLCKFIYSNYGSLFDGKFISKIKGLKKKDFKSICNYNHKEDTFSGLEYSILRHLIDYHLKEFEKDLKSGRLDEIIKLSVSKDNLIVKVFPVKSTDDNPVSYTISLLYLVLMHLYKQINRHVYNDLYKYKFNKLSKEKYANWVIKSVFTFIVPIATKVTYTIKTNADDNWTWFSQLKQLDSAYGFFNISKQSGQVKFCFRPHTHYLTSTLDFPVINETPSDTNFKKRFIESTYTLEKDNILKCKTTIINKEMVDCVFATQIDKDDEPASIYSALSDDEEIYLAQYSILRRMLSFTKQHEKQKVQIRLNVTEYVKQGKYNLVTQTTNTNKIKWLSRTKTVKHAFDEVKSSISDDKIILIIYKELQKLGQKNSYVDYTIAILELMNEEKRVIDDTLKPLDVRTADKIKKIIKKLQSQKFTCKFTLNEFYKEY